MASVRLSGYHHGTASPPISPSSFSSEIPSSTDCFIISSVGEADSRVGCSSTEPTSLESLRLARDRVDRRSGRRSTGPSASDVPSPSWPWVSSKSLSSPPEARVCRVRLAGYVASPSSPSLRLRFPFPPLTRFLRGLVRLISLAATAAMELTVGPGMSTSSPASFVLASNLR